MCTDKVVYLRGDLFYVVTQLLQKALTFLKMFKNIELDPKLRFTNYVENLYFLKFSKKIDFFPFFKFAKLTIKSNITQLVGL